MPAVVERMYAHSSGLRPGAAEVDKLLEQSQDRVARTRWRIDCLAQDFSPNISVSAIAEIAALIGDPARMNMVSALRFTAELNAGELARLAGVTPQTASGHLAKLTAAGLLKVRQRGRERLFHLGSDRVAILLDALQLAVTKNQGRCTSAAYTSNPLYTGRVCHGHMSGALAASLAASLLVQVDGVAGLSAGALHKLALFGIGTDVCEHGPSGVELCRERSDGEVHIGGALGTSIFNRCTELGWLRQSRLSGSFVFTPAGINGLKNRFDL